jgi:hypothetical protein
MRYEVPNVKLIPQSQTLSCWYASAQMVIQWRRQKVLMTEANLVDPGELPQYIAMVKHNDAIPWATIRRFAQDLGLVPLPLVSPSEELLASWLRLFGPLWADGMKYVTNNGTTQSYGHVVVIAGISSSPDPNEILILDPENGGGRGWEPISRLVSILSDGANPNRNAFLLRLP